MRKQKRKKRLDDNKREKSQTIFPLLFFNLIVRKKAGFLLLVVHPFIPHPHTPHPEKSDLIVLNN